MEEINENGGITFDEKSAEVQALKKYIGSTERTMHYVERLKTCLNYGILSRKVIREMYVTVDVVRETLVTEDFLNILFKFTPIENPNVHSAQTNIGRMFERDGAEMEDERRRNEQEKAKAYYASSYSASSGDEGGHRSGKVRIVIEIDRRDLDKPLNKIIEQYIGNGSVMVIGDAQHWEKASKQSVSAASSLTKNRASVRPPRYRRSLSSFLTLTGNRNSINQLVHDIRCKAKAHSLPMPRMTVREVR